MSRTVPPTLLKSVAFPPHHRRVPVGFRTLLLLHGAKGVLLEVVHLAKRKALRLYKWACNKKIFYETWEYVKSAGRFMIVLRLSNGRGKPGKFVAVME
jgi:hypothetical protein